VFLVSVCFDKKNSASDSSDLCSLHFDLALESSEWTILLAYLGASRASRHRWRLQFQAEDELIAFLLRP
jgi:hypothetical protein